MTMSTSSSCRPYALDNDRPTAPAILDQLSAILDEFSTGRLVRAGVAGGSRCLEVGAGNGSIAGWLAERVGPTGRVVAMDLKPQHIRRHPRVETAALDVAIDELPAGPYDVIHARLLLAHLPQRHAVLGRLIEQLAPGGALVIEEWGAAGPASVLSAPNPAAAGLYGRYQRALLEVFRASGNDGTWAMRVPEVMSDAGLTNVESAVYARSWRGGTAGCLLPIAVAQELREPLIEVGANGEDLDRLAHLLSDPELLLLGNVTVSTIGYRPR
jgi:SAM-dependent methyltransferase